MLSNCRKSCNTCDVVDPTEMAALVLRRMELHEVGGDETLLETPYGVTQDVSASVKEQVSEVINNFTFYMDNFIFAKEEYAAVKKTCKNRHRQCAYWKTLGECENVSACLHVCPLQRNALRCDLFSWCVIELDKTLY